MPGLPRHLAAVTLASILLVFSSLTLAYPAHSLGTEQRKIDEDLRTALANLARLKEAGLNVTYFENLVVQAETQLKDPSTQQHSITDLRANLAKLSNQLQKVVNIFGRDAEKGFKAFTVLIDVYVLKAKAVGIAAILVDTAEQLFEQTTADAEGPSWAAMLTKAETLLEGVKSILAGKPISIKVTRTGEDEGEQTEVSIASIPTSKDMVKVYFTEERLRYQNNTTVVSKNAFINLGNTLIIQRQTVKSVQFPSEEKEIHLGDNAGIGAVISLSRVSNKLQLDKTEYDVTVQSYSFEQNLVRLVLTSTREDAGKLVIIDVDKSFMKNYLPREITVRVDGYPAVLSQTVTEVLSGTSEEPKYFLALTGRGLQIVLYIPHWSTKVVIIGSSASLAFQISIPNVVGENMEWWATTIAAAGLVSAVIVGKLLGRRMGW
ncbi:MAG: hypothetical protein QW419_01255 [Candidatus Caldarchaeum sp.]